MVPWSANHCIGATQRRPTANPVTTHPDSPIEIHCSVTSVLGENGVEIRLRRPLVPKNSSAGAGSSASTAKPIQRRGTTARRRAMA